MDDLSFLVEETLRVNDLRQAGVKVEDLEDGEEFWNPMVHAPAPIRRALPSSAGVFYHLENQGGTFIVRTMPSSDLGSELEAIKATPEDFPSLRLVREDENRLSMLNWFACETLGEAEAIHARVGHRRFPLREEDVCNLSDPGFSWWLENEEGQFTLHSKMGLLRENLVRLGPLADAQIAPHRWSELDSLFTRLPLSVSISNEGSRLVMSAEEDDRWVMEEFRRVFVEGKLSQELVDLFRLLGKRGVAAGTLETCWFFLKEISAVRSFWITIESEL